MTTRQLFIDRMKVLYRDLIVGRNIAFNRPRSYEVEILPSGSQKKSGARAHSIKLGIIVAASPVSARADRVLPH